MIDHADRPRTEQAAVSIHDLRVRFGDTDVLRGVSARFVRGEIAVVLGASGSGKTTLLKHILGLLRPQHGRVEVLGVELADATESELAAVRRRMGVLFQQGALLNSATVFENVRIPLEQHAVLPEAVMDRIVRTKLALVGLESAEAALPSELSGGMRKRASLARALALDPDLLLCDEPSSGLDPVTARSLDQLLRDLQRRLGMTMIVISHDMAGMRRTADRVFFLQRGQIAFTGTVDEADACDVEEVREFLSAAV
ncbi:MAG: ATP-binding cassette domain-containing protein [Spirochaetaceae bacterium]|nr:MAG: ATP-binding cassette domain-containing protein [Spirochaetaceae bacterium]